MKPITLIKSELYRQGGLEKYTWRLAAAFCEKGCPVTLLTTQVSHPPFSHPLLNIVSLPIDRPLFSFLNLLQFDKACQNYLLKHPTPIVFSLDRNRLQTHIRAGNGVHAAYLTRRAKEEGTLKKISFDINPLHRSILSFEKQAFEHPELKLLFTNSEMVKREVLEWYQTAPQKIAVVHNGVEWEGLEDAFTRAEEKRAASLKHQGLDPDAFQFLFLGHNFRRKGLEKLLYALELIRKTPFQLSIVGKDKDLPYFKSLCEELSLQNKVFFFGSQQEVIPFYQMADSLVIPSLYDPFANVTVEALAMGVFVLSSKHNGGHEILTPENGAVIESLDDREAFAATLQKAMEHPKTPSRASTIRQSIRHLDFPHQLRLIVEKTLL